jgi:serine/threonine protein kinase
MVQLIKSPDKKSIEIIVKVTDFGFAVRMDPTKDERTSLGSPHYTAPEVIYGLKYDGRCDVWSLGIIAYMILCGRYPF